MQISRPEPERKSSPTRAVMESIRYVDLQSHYDSIRTEVLAALEEICKLAKFAQGPPPTEFETKFGDYCGVQDCVSLNSGTSALDLALRCLDIGPGDEVLTVAMTFIVPAWSISYNGAEPIFVDIDPARHSVAIPLRSQRGLTRKAS